MASLICKEIHVYGCACAGLTQLFVFYDSGIQSTTVAGAKAQTKFMNVFPCCFKLKYLLKD